MNKRNYGVELFRVLLMVGITLLHTLATFGLGCTFTGRLLHVCVVGFVFISGWYGIKFSAAKIGRLYGLGFFAAIATAAMQACLAGEGVAAGIRNLFDYLSYFWFLHAYAVLACFSPILNMVFEKSVPESVSSRTLAPVLALVFGYCFLASLPLLRDWMPQFAGGSVHGFLTLVGIYLAAMWARARKMDQIPARALVCIAVFSAVPCGFGLGKYNSPFALCFAAALFLLVLRIGVSDGIGRVAVFLSKSMFSVYLLQIGFIGIWLPPRLQQFGCTGYSGALASAMAVFVVCLLLDCGRRAVFATLRLFYGIIVHEKA